MTRVLIVEDAPMDRQLLELYVKQSGQYELVPSVESAAFAEADNALSMAEELVTDTTLTVIPFSVPTVLLNSSITLFSGDFV